MSGRPAFLLFDEGDWHFERVMELRPRWTELAHAESRSRGFILLPGEVLRSPRFRVDADHCLIVDIMRGLERISPDGLDVVLSLHSTSGQIPLAQAHLGNSLRRHVPLGLRVDLRPYEGLDVQLEVRCAPGAAGDPTADWAAVQTLAVVSTELGSLATSRSQYAWRLANETGHFTGVYDRELYRHNGVEPPATAVAIETVESGAASLAVGNRVDPRDVQKRLAASAPIEGESAYGYALRMLAGLIERPLIDFAQRLSSFRPQGERLRFMSLCAGAARVEESLFRTAGVNAELTLVDLNESLLAQAAARMPSSLDVKLVRGSVEELRRIVEPPYDIVCFVSGLHHVVALEEVLDGVHDVLGPDGELWLIGEQLGRNGNRMWPEARRAAERVFARLPAHLRRNHNTGVVDERLPDLNFGTSSFEGVRSEDMPAAVARRFTAVQENVRSCFLWRLIDLAYIPNFDVHRESDVEALRMMVAEEYAFYANGGIGCELNGIYRDKLRA